MNVDGCLVRYMVAEIVKRMLMNVLEFLCLVHVADVSKMLKDFS